jgi:hypothetical protein
MNMPAFKQLCEEAVQNRDGEGEIPRDDSNKVRRAFRMLSGDDQLKAKRWVDDKLKDQITELDMMHARAWLKVSEGLGKKQARQPNA